MFDLNCANVVDATYLTSPECDRIVFARTCSRIPGTPPTLQNGMRTAACRRRVLPIADLWVSSCGERQSLTSCRVLLVNGLVKEKIGEDPKAGAVVLPRSMIVIYHIGFESKLGLGGGCLPLSVRSFMVMVVPLSVPA